MPPIAWMDRNEYLVRPDTRSVDEPCQGVVQEDLLCSPVADSAQKRGLLRAIEMVAARLRNRFRRWPAAFGGAACRNHRE